MPGTMRKRDGDSWYLEVTIGTDFRGKPNRYSKTVHGTKKQAEIHLHTYQDSTEARGAIFEYIDGWYNRKRIHSAIGYMTPQQKEDEELKTAT